MRFAQTNGETFRWLRSIIIPAAYGRGLRPEHKPGNGFKSCRRCHCVGDGFGSLSKQATTVYRPTVRGNR
ncbi:MAG: hypothetical protein AAFO94_05520 [Bacteroidota bacterium]